MYICGGHSIIRKFTCLVKGIDFLLACDVVLIISKNLKSVWGLIRGKTVSMVFTAVLSTINVTFGNIMQIKFYCMVWYL